MTLSIATLGSTCPMGPFRRPLVCGHRPTGDARFSKSSTGSCGPCLWVSHGARPQLVTFSPWDFLSRSSRAPDTSDCADLAERARGRDSALPAAASKTVTSLETRNLATSLAPLRRWDFLGRAKSSAQPVRFHFAGAAFGEFSLLLRHPPGQIPALVTLVGSLCSTCYRNHPNSLTLKQCDAMRAMRTAWLLKAQRASRSLAMPPCSGQNCCRPNKTTGHTGMA